MKKNNAGLVWKGQLGRHWRLVRQCVAASTPPRLRAGLVLGWLGLMLSPGLAAAHPFHTSTAEAEWNAETKRLEVAMRVSGEDLEAALNSKSKERVQLEDGDAADEAIQAYLKESFVIRKSTEDEPLELYWVGKEVTPKAVWLYFEVGAPEGVAGHELTNRLLLDVEATQINTLVLKLDGRKVSLRCDRKRPTVAIRATDEAQP